MKENMMDRIDSENSENKPTIQSTKAIQAGQSAAGLSSYPIYTDIVSLIWVVIRYLWVIIPIGIIGTAIVFFVLQQQPDIYESRASVIIYPQINPGDENQILQVVDTMRYNIVGTYVQLLRSKTVIDKAEEIVEASFDPSVLEDVVIDIRPIENSSVIAIAVRSLDPDASQALVNAIIQETIRNNVSLGPINEVYPLQILDPGSYPDEPVGSSTTVGLVIGMIASVAIGVGVAFAIDSTRKANRASRES